MEAERFIEAVSEMRLAEVLDDRDLRCVHALLAKAIDGSADRVLVGFRVRDPVKWIVWAEIEMIQVGQVTGEDLAPGLPPSEEGYEAWDFRCDGFWLMEPAKGRRWLNSIKAKPPELEDLPAVIVSYSGRLSWQELDQALRQQG